MIEIKKLDDITLDNNLATIANTIRTKIRTTGTLSFSQNFEEKIENNLYLIDNLFQNNYYKEESFTIQGEIIRPYAFYNSPITEIHGPNVLTFGGSDVGTLNEGYQFYQNTNLTKIDFPKLQSVTGSFAFAKCTNLSSVELPSIVETGSSMFKECSNLTSFSAPMAITIGGSCFSNDSNLESKNFYAPLVTTIGPYGFDSCKKITEFPCPNVETIGAQSFIYSGLTGNLSLNYLTTIGDRAFESTNITNAFFPEVTTIGKQAFYLSKLTSISCPKITTLGQSAFLNCRELSSIELASVTSIGQSAFGNCSSITAVNFLPEVTSIGQQAFNGCTGIITVSLPKVTSINSYGFNGCASLTSISLPEVTSIDTYAFQSCTSLTSISLPKVTSINSYAFQSCTGLTSILLPEITSISEYAFYNCISLASISLPKVTSIGKCTFSRCTSLTSISLPYVKTLGTYAFQGCNNVLTINLPHITTINVQSFDGCSKLKKVDIGDSKINLTSSGIFLNCSLFDTFILRRTDNIVSLGNLNIFNDTPFADGNTGGTLYVPQALLSTYQNDTNWSVILGYTDENENLQNQILPLEGSQYEFYNIDGVGVLQVITINIPQKNNRTSYFSYSNTQTEIPYNDAYTTTIDFSPFNYNDLDISILMGETDITSTALTINNNIGIINIAHVTAPLTISIDLPEPDSNTQLFTEAALGLSQTRGSITVPETGWRTMTSTGSANWGITISYKGTATLFKQMNSMYGHTIRMDLDVEWLKEVSGAQFYITPCGCTNITNTTPQRRGYVSFSIPSGTNFKGTVLFKLPDNKDEWPSTTTNYPAGDNDYLSARFFLYSNNTGSVRINSVAFYDLGILEESE